MNTKLLLMASSLLVAMNGINVGQAMDHYYMPIPETPDQNTIQLKEKITTLANQLLLPEIEEKYICNLLISEIVEWIAHQKSIINDIKNYSFDTSEEFFSFVFNKIRNNKIQLNYDTYKSLIALRSIMIENENSEYYENKEHVRLVDQFISLIILQDMHN